MVASGLIALVLASWEPFQGWSWQDTAREAAFAGLLLVDAGETQSFLQEHECASWTHYQAVGKYWLSPTPAVCSGTWHPYREMDPLLGHDPSPGKMYLLGSSLLLGHALVAGLLPREWRSAWQYSAIGVEFGFVARNARLFGLQLQYRW